MPNWSNSSTAPKPSAPEQCQKPTSTSTLQSRFVWLESDFQVCEKDRIALLDHCLGAQLVKVGRCQCGLLKMRRPQVDLRVAWYQSDNFERENY